MGRTKSYPASARTSSSRAAFSLRGSGVTPRPYDVDVALKIWIVPFGREASRVLRDEIALAQAGHPLAPVTVIVSRNITGLGVRRLLASGDLGPAPSSGRLGVANVRFTTLPRLADELAGSISADGGAMPATATVIHAAARMTLGTSPTKILGPVRDHPGTARSLVRLYRDLSGVSMESRRRLVAGSGRAAEVMSLVEEMERRIGDGWYDEGRRFDRAIEALSGMGGEEARQGTEAEELVVVYLPSRLPLHSERFITALAAIRRVMVIVGVTGDRAADSTSQEIVTRLGRKSHQSVSTAIDLGLQPLRGTSVISAPTADTEVRVVIRELMARSRTGTRFERMAIVHGGTGPYERLVRETLAGAAIPCNGVSTRMLGATFAGRTLLGAFELHERGWRRGDIMDWVAGGPIRDGGGERKPVEATAWDLISRDAGVTIGLDNWRRHLGAYGEDRSASLAELDGPAGSDAKPSTAHRLRTELRQSVELRTFVEDLAQQFDPSPHTWADWVVWANNLLDRYLGKQAERDEAWPTDEREALTAVRSALEGLEVLDRLHEVPDRSTFRQALIAELEAPAPQTSRFGTGVLVGPVNLLAGLDLDTVFVLGMVDGAFPVRESDDALLPDDERVSAGDDVPLRGGRRNDAHRDYLAGLATAPERVLSFARGNQRRGGEQRPARWLLDTLGALEGTGRRLFSRDVEDLGRVDGFSNVHSFADAVLNVGEPMSLGDWDLRSLLEWRVDGHDLTSHFLSGTGTELGAGFEVHRSRNSNRFTRFDGRIDRVDVPSPTSAAALSPTSLETYAGCPRRYVMQRVLRIEERDNPEDVVTIDPAHRGLMIHEILERFIEVQLRLPREHRIRPGQPWSSDDHARMIKLAEQVFQRYEDRGLLGRRLMWDLARTTIERELHQFLKRDDEYRAAGGWVPERVELEFGPGHGEPVSLELPGQRSVSFKGYIDRVDMASDGSLSVTDYKTGLAKEVDGLTGDPVLNGRKLQLPLYGLAARNQFGDRPVRVAYWFVSEKGKFKWVTNQLGPPILDRFRDVVTVLVDGIEAGMFPARPGNGGSNCTYCSFQAMCPGDRQRSWDRVRHAPELGAYVALTEGREVDR